MRRSAGRVAARSGRWYLHFTCRLTPIVYVEEEHDTRVQVAERDLLAMRSDPRPYIRAT